MKPRLIACALLTLFGTIGAAAADSSTKVMVSPATAHPGDPVLVTVTGVTEEPKGKANGHALEFFPARSGYQAVFAIPLDATPDTISVEIESAVRPASVKVIESRFPETAVVVEDELANPPKADRDRIDADNVAILAALAKAKGDPRFVRAFVRPPGEVTSVYGEWRTFNDGHRSQHLGLDLFAREGSKVKAVNAGTVVLVRDCFLAGNVVVVAHGAGLASAYFHLSQTSVAEGDTVSQGAEIGLAGHTGRTTGPHLHISMRVPGGFVNPVGFFKLPLAPAATKITHR
jgi:murein DD-endopeptidase MepM/ murein hydrolase activator NlpD